MADHKTLAEALAAFQAEVPKMSKDETAKVTGKTKDGAPVSYKYGYAGLDQFVEIVEPVLGKHGLSITSKTTLDANGNFLLEVSLLHEGGDRETGFWPLPDPRRSGPQDIGSAMTYGRRYIGWGLTGTFPGGVDDDGAQAQQAARNNWENAQPVRQQAPAQPPAPEKTSWTDAEVAEYQAKLKTIDPEALGAAYDWMAERNIHNRPVGASGVTATLITALVLADRALLPNATPKSIAWLKTIGETRGLMKVKVSATETLEEALFMAHELAVHAAAETAKSDARQDEGAALAEEQGD